MIPGCGEDRIETIDQRMRDKDLQIERLSRENAQLSKVNERQRVELECYRAIAPGRVFSAEHKMLCYTPPDED